jgi:hypothetical protein
VARLVAVLGLPHIVPAKPEPGGRAAGMRGLMPTALIFAGVTTATGVLVAFLPLAGSPGLASAALLTPSLTTPVARWLAGRFGGCRTRRWC